MNDQQLIEAYLEGEEHLVDLQDQINDANAKLSELGAEWHKTHSCSCGLIGLQNCPHTQPKKPTGPKVESAADAARSVSRMLKRKGFLMCNRSNSHRWTEGIVVHRVGCSNQVSVSYHTTYGTWSREEKAEQATRSRDAMTTVRKLLLDKGYEFNSMGYIVCKGA